MRVLVLGLFICIAANAVGQCPIQPRQASVDASGKNVTIRYYNSGVRLVRDVQFVLTTEDKEPSGQPVLTNFSARGVLRPKQERVALFPRRGGMGAGPLLHSSQHSRCPVLVAFFCDRAGILTSYPHNDSPQLKSVNQNAKCKMYTVQCTRLCPFYHTGPLALSMTWETRVGIFPDFRSLRTRSGTRTFAFCATTSRPHPF